ncbi:uncharacterized protein LOC122815197 isoform X2 [Protopterus annectens]|uniref:uncharacterized protein LOC122815197 isoform X2 n=1 Tax=Protopterus annectens TaxID=7888 RepID=UPI001CFC0820|nr:uncharacterized protein LOC122815197 isoform X2 [Protopterus annectens]
MACAKDDRCDETSSEDLDTDSGEESWETDTDLSAAENKVSWSSSSDNGKGHDDGGDDDDEDNDSDVDTRRPQRRTREPCKYYNQGSCRDGRNCKYPHICQYFFKGYCKYGTNCKYSHHQQHKPGGTKNGSQEWKKPVGKHYQWRLCKGQQWSNIENDWIIEAQYSMPEVKGMEIYNTKYGAVCIDFINMRVRGKTLKVQRKTFPSKDGGDAWLWYFHADSNWKQYDAKDSKGKSISITSAAIERKYQENKRGSYQFTISQNSYKISFREMVQINLQSGTKRKVRRRPAFTLPKTDGNGISDNFQLLNVSGKHIWQFKGSHGDWHEFKKGTRESCSVSSDNIEASYTQNPQGSIQFSAGSKQFQLDFSTMTQTNLATKRTRKVRRL